MIDRDLLLRAIYERHSVRQYKTLPLPHDAIATIRHEVAECNAKSGLNIQLVLSEPRAFSGPLAYGKFTNVDNYLVLVGRRGGDNDEAIGYYGELLVLTAQALGLNTCWAGLSYRTVKGVYDVRPGERVACMIALGYGVTPGKGHKIKRVSDVSNADGSTPAWFTKAVEAALLCPTAINQQKFSFEYLGFCGGDKAVVRAHRGRSLVGYTHIDVGIAKLHFELAAGDDTFQWAEKK